MSCCEPNPSAFGLQLRIPMRGYENGLKPTNVPAESLRIPMRGYEATLSEPVRFKYQVTNPHAGL